MDEIIIKHAGGRPTKFSEELKTVIINLVKDGKTLEQVAETIGIAESSVYLWISRYKFSEDLKEARLSPSDLVKMSLFRKAVGYSCKETKVFNVEGRLLTKDVTKTYAPDTTACIFWLKNRRPDEWKDREPESEESRNIKITMSYDPSKTLEERDLSNGKKGTNNTEIGDEKPKDISS